MTLAGSLTAVSGYALLIEPSEFEIEKTKVKAELPPGLVIGALSDFHLADTISHERVETAVRQLAREAPDLIVLLGDYSTAMHSGADIYRHVSTTLEILSSLSAPLGVYAIPGNHDITPSLPDIALMIRSHGIVPLIDASVTLAVHGERFGIAGLNDALRTNPDPQAAMGDVPAGVSLLGLVHEPDAAPLLSRASLVLSGHSHGGQVRLPVIGAPVLPNLGRRFPWGLRSDGNLLIYTSRGVGMVPPRIRINCRPEITIIEIVSAGGRTPLGPAT